MHRMPLRDRTCKNGRTLCTACRCGTAPVKKVGPYALHAAASDEPRGARLQPVEARLGCKQSTGASRAREGHVHACSYQGSGYHTAMPRPLCSTQPQPQHWVEQPPQSLEPGVRAPEQLQPHGQATAARQCLSVLPDPSCSLLAHSSERWAHSKRSSTNGWARTLMAHTRAAGVHPHPPAP